jgi:hypothetical protein
MPIYTYRRESTGEYIDVLQSMNEAHEYRGQNNDEDDWKRVFYSPNASIDTNIDPFSSKDFNDRTASKKGTVGDMLDYSKEMSQKRADLAGGKDPIKEKYFENYSKERRGAKHPEQMKSFESKNVKIDYN